MHLPMYIYICMNISLYISSRDGMHQGINIYICIYIYTYTYVYLHIYIYVPVQEEKGRGEVSGSVGRNATEVEEANEQQVFQSRHILHRTKQVPVGLRSGGHGSTIFELKVSPPRLEDKVLIENDIVIDKSTSGLTLEPDKTPMIPAMSMLFSPDGSHTSIHSFMGESIQGDQSTSWKQGSQAQRSFILGYESVASTIA